MLKLSIIVPVYNVEKYIRPCIESIFKQGLDENDFEVIIVNDGTKDRSMEIIADIVNKHNNIVVINQENQSLSVARNNGIAQAKGQYILMPDSDDLLIENSLLPLLEKAMETKVDLLVADYKAMSDDDIKHFHGIEQKELTFHEMTGEELFIKELNPHHCYVWRTLYRRSFLSENSIVFIPGINYQDVPFTNECYLKAKHCIKSSQLLYVYRYDRPGAASSFFSIQKARSFSIAIAKTWKLRQIKGLSSDIRNKLEEGVFTSFRVMIFRTSYGIKKISDRNKIMDTLNSIVPDLNFTHNPKQRFTTFMIRKLPHLYINLYYIYAQIFFKHLKTT